MKKKDFIKKIGKGVHWPSKLENPASLSFSTGKKQLHEIMKAKMQKKKAPKLKIASSDKKNEYKKLSIAEWEEKFLNK